MPTSRKTHFIRANLHTNYVRVVDNPKLISRKSKKEECFVSQIPLVKANSCATEWLFLGELPFDVPFDLSSFRTKSEHAIDEIVLDPNFIADIEV